MENPDTDQWNQTVQQILDGVCNHPPKAPFPRPLCQALALLAQALFSQLSATSSVKHEWSLRKVASDLEQCCDALSLPAERLVTASKPWETQATPDLGCFLQVCAAALRGSVKMKFLIFGCILKWKTMEVNLIGGHAVTCSPSFASYPRTIDFFKGCIFFFRIYLLGRLVYLQREALSSWVKVLWHVNVHRCYCEWLMRCGSQSGNLPPENVASCLSFLSKVSFVAEDPRPKQALIHPKFWRPGYESSMA